MENNKKQESPKKRAMIKIDDTVAMANKYRKLAQRDIVEKIIINDNTVNWMMIQFRMNQVSMSYKYYIKFYLNGTLCEDTIETNIIMSKKKMIQYLFDEIAKRISYMLLQNSKNLFI